MRAVLSFSCSSWFVLYIVMLLKVKSYGEKFDKGDVTC